MAILPFYGADEPELFEIERQSMDRKGKVLRALDHHLPVTGLIADIGAGTGFTALRLASEQRRIVAVEPNRDMVRPDAKLRWVRGDAGHMPFADGSFDAAYATWAYFFTRAWDPWPGLIELHRIVGVGGALVVVDNLGGDEFSTFSPDDMSADAERWSGYGFSCEQIDTHFEFDSLQDAIALFTRFFGGRAGRRATTSVGHRVGLFHSTSRGSDFAGSRTK